MKLFYESQFSSVISALNIGGEFFLLTKNSLYLTLSTDISYKKQRLILT
jgi:hypothetical protein